MTHKSRSGSVHGGSLLDSGLCPAMLAFGRLGFLGLLTALVSKDLHALHGLCLGAEMALLAAVAEVAAPTHLCEDKKGIQTTGQNKR